MRGGSGESEARGREDNEPILGSHFDSSSGTEQELGKSGSTARMVAHDALEPSLFTDFDAIEMESEHLCIVISSLGLEEVAKPLGGQIIAPREDVVGDRGGDFVSDTIGKLDILPDFVAGRVGCSK